MNKKAIIYSLKFVSRLVVFSPIIYITVHIGIAKLLITAGIALMSVVAALLLYAVAEREKEKI